MASDLPLSDIRPTSRPSAAGANREVALPAAGLAAIGAAGVALSLAAVLVTTSGAGPEPHGLMAVAHALVIAAPIAAGLYAVHRNPGARFGWLLVLAGFLWSPTILAESSDGVLYSVGRVWVWFAELLLIYLVLVFPSGRLTSRADRLLFRAGVFVVGLYLTLTLFGDYPEPSPWASCGTDCPANAFMVTSQLSLVEDVLMPITQAASVLLFAAVALQLLPPLDERLQPHARGARAGTGRGPPANGCHRGLPHCARS